MDQDAAEEIRRVFFAYPSRPESEREAVATAAEDIALLNVASVTTWEELAVAGHLVVDTIKAAIDTSHLLAADVTAANANVMFELGYGIGSNRPVWLLRDPSDLQSKRIWEQVALLTTTGWAPFTNSRDIVEAFTRDRPDQNPSTIFEEAIQPSLRPSTTPTVFHVPSPYPTEVHRALSKSLRWHRQRGIQYVTADPTETAVQTLAWYGQRVYEAGAVVVHLSPPRRRDADIHNARCAFIAGLAEGMRRPILLVAEEEFQSPIDYRDLLVVCANSRECATRITPWLDNALREAYHRVSTAEAQASRVALATELASIRLGDPVAENEEDFLDRYFVETAAFEDVMAERTTVFVGRKGTGKTANLIEAANRLSRDVRNLVCVVKPITYEWESLLRVLGKFEQRDTKGHVVEVLWKYLLYSEIALAASQEMSRRAVPPVPGSPVDRLMQLVSDPNLGLQEEFSVRLERAVALLDTVALDDRIEAQRSSISEVLHGGLLRELREVLGQVLRNRRRVAVLVDNLDKPWHRSADIEHLTTFLIGLVGSASRVAEEFGRRDRWREPIPLTLAVFVRSDIFAKLLVNMREPDKVPVSRLNWADGELLTRVLEERFIAAKDGTVDGHTLWDDYICPTTKGQTTKDYILWRALPRPRDIIFFATAAISTAVNRRKTGVEEADVLEAEKAYSRFAFDAVLVEAEATLAGAETVLMEFVGERYLLTAAELADLLARAGIGERDVSMVISELVGLSFLGVETSDGVFQYVDDVRDQQRNDRLARRLAEQRGTPVQYVVHPAFRPYLEITEAAA
jgi:hypothetical protein